MDEARDTPGDHGPSTRDPVSAGDPDGRAHRGVEAAAVRRGLERRADRGDIDEPPAQSPDDLADHPHDTAAPREPESPAEDDAPAERMSLFGVVKTSFKEFGEDDAMSYAAAVAFYTALSFAPLVVVLLAAIALFYGDAAKANLVDQLRQFGGEGVAAMARQAIDNADKQPGVSSFSGLIALATLLFSATGVFAQLQHALNFMWDVKQKPGGGIGGFARKRLLSLGMLLTLGFLLLVALGVSAVIQATFGRPDPQTGATDPLAWLWVALNLGVSFAVFMLLFAAMYKVLPDVDVEWRDVWIGAGITAVLFVVGKWAIGKYIGVTGTGSAYGAAGSLLVLLVWVYYSAIILFLGAEVTQVWARRQGRTITPDKHAVWRNC